MSLLRVLFLCILLGGFYSCTDSDFTVDPETENEPVDDLEGNTINLPENYQTLLDRVNELRASGCRCGAETMLPVNPVSWNANLGEAALRHAQDMSRNSHFSHTGTDGSNAGERILATGYLWRTYGENIAFGYSTADAVFDGWKNSPGHCRNIMNPAFTEMGAAEVARYWSQEFATKRE